LEQQSKYKFKYFQTLSYEFSLPEGFKPERLVVELNPSTKNAKKTQHSFTWDELIKEAG
jgi:poly(3-hydroxybutyrate) depolymerase